MNFCGRVGDIAGWECCGLCGVSVVAISVGRGSIKGMARDKDVPIPQRVSARSRDETMLCLGGRCNSFNPAVAL